MLALDPFYEMFPTTYRRSYPPGRYSWGDSNSPGAIAVVPAGTATLNEVARKAIIFSIASFTLGVGLTAATAAIMWRRRR